MALDRSYSSRLGHTESFSSLGTDSNDARATQERRRRLSAMKTQLYSRDNDDDRSVDSQMDGSDKSAGSTTMDASLKSFTSWLGSKGGGGTDKRSSKSSNTSTTSSNSSSSNLSSQDSLGSGGSGSQGQKQRQSSVLGKMLSWGGSARFVDNKSNESMGDDVSDDSSVSLDDDDIFSFPTTNGSSLNGSGAFHNSGRGSLLDNAHPTTTRSNNNRSSSRLGFDNNKESDHEERKLSPQVEARRKRMVEKVLNGLNNKEEETEEKEKEPSSKERQPRTRRAAKPRPSIRQEAEPEEPKDAGPLLYGDKVATYKVDSAKEVQRLKAAKLAKKASRDDLMKRDDGAPTTSKRTPRRQRSSIRAFRSTDGPSMHKTGGGASAPLRRNRTVDPNASARRLSSASIALNWNAGAGPAAAEEPPKESSSSSTSSSSSHSAPKEPGLQRRHTNASIRPRRQRTVNLEDSPTSSTKDDASVASVRRTYGQSRPRRTTSTIEGESRLRRAGSQRPEGRPRRSASSKKLPPRLATH